MNMIRLTQPERVAAVLQFVGAPPFRTYAVTVRALHTADSVVWMQQARSIRKAVSEIELRIDPRVWDITSATLFI